MKTERRTAALLTVVLSALFFATSIDAADRTKPKAASKKRVTIEELKLQAQQAKRQFPELFEFLEKRDQTLQRVVFELADQIPNPDDLPEITIPESLVVELAKPRSEEECKKIWKQNPLGIRLPAKTRARLYWYCVNGIYIRNGSFSGLTK